MRKRHRAAETVLSPWRPWQEMSTMRSRILPKSCPVLARMAGRCGTQHKKRCRFGSEWSMCKWKIWAFLHCILWSFTIDQLRFLASFATTALLQLLSLQHKPKCAHVGPLTNMQIRQWHWHPKLLARWSNFPHDEPVGSLINACQQQFAQQCVFGTSGINRAHVFVHTNAKRMQWQHVVNSLWIGSCALQLYASLCDILAKSL